MFADIPGQEAPGGGTIPSDILVSAQKPDLVILDRLMYMMTIFEITVPFETRLQQSRQLKQNKYAHLVHDLECKGWQVNRRTVEVGSRGLINKENTETLTSFLEFTKDKRKPKKFLATISQLAIIGSFKLFLARRDASWT